MSLLPQATGQPELPPKTEISACHSPPQIFPAGWLLSVIQASGEMSPSGTLRVPPQGAARAHPSVVRSAPPDGTAGPQTEWTSRARLAQTASRPFPRPGEAHSPPPRSAPGPHSTRGPASRTRAPAAAASRPSGPAPAALLSAVGGKSVNSGACALRGPGKSVRQPLSSRIAVHLIGCSAAPVNSASLRPLLAAGAPCRSLKSWYCKDAQRRSPVVFYRCGNEPREGKRFMLHKLMAKPGV